MLYILILLGIALLGIWIFTSKGQRYVQRDQPLKTADQILDEYKALPFKKILINFNYKGSQLQALLSDILVMGDKFYALGIENTTAVRIYTMKDMKEITVSGQTTEISELVEQLPQTEYDVDLFSAEGKVATQPLRDKLESMQAILEALNSQGGYQQSPLEIYVQRYE